MVDVDASVKDGWADLADDKSSTSWVLFGYSDDGKKVLKSGSGEGGLSALLNGLEDDKVQFGGFRCNAVDNAEQTTRTSPKFVFVTWVGQNVGALKKAKTSFHKQAVAQVIAPIHLEMQVNTKDELSPEIIQKALIDNAGAHKPQRVEF
eukprot:comp6910_c0_seq1/m.6885 comp6910_c0_seq1/g.6885  ORF comp6910_c0_seq1/g.6885 comp6910_c0_seq1/m.6885 type:complete len:149 (+) comp6910_c0_seq1:56-502(+)